MEQAESNLDSLRVFTTEKWFVKLGMAARGIACCSKCGSSGRIVRQVPAFKLPACPRVTLVFYRQRALRTSARGQDAFARFRQNRQKEAARGCGGRGALWELNRHLLESHCKKKSCTKTLLLMLINISLLASSELILTPEGSRSRRQSGNSSDACGLYTR